MIIQWDGRNITHACGYYMQHLHMAAKVQQQWHQLEGWRSSEAPCRQLESCCLFHFISPHCSPAARHQSPTCCLVSLLCQSVSLSNTVISASYIEQKRSTSLLQMWSKKIYRRTTKLQLAIIYPTIDGSTSTCLFHDWPNNIVMTLCQTFAKVWLTICSNN